jgi:hypothetical protein
MVLRVLGAVLGGLLLIATSASIIGTLVVPRSIDSRISRYVEKFVDHVFAMLTFSARDFEHRDHVLAWQAPTALVTRLATWITLLVAGFSLILLPLVPGNPGHAFSEAGSSMFTLGYSAPTNSPSTLVDYVAAFAGLIVVGLQIGYLPTLYSAFNRRETEVTLLISRAGVPAWGPEILARTRWGIVNIDVPTLLDELFTGWERWAAEVAESHTTYLTLARLRSPRPLSHWLTSLLAVMDAAAIHLAISPNGEPKLSARLCLRMGFVAMNQIAGSMRLAVIDDPDPDGDISISRAEFDQALEMLRAVNYPIERDGDDAWAHFRGWRVNYDSVALALAKMLDAPPALWSGERRWPSTPMSPRRPAARTPRPTES